MNIKEEFLKEINLNIDIFNRCNISVINNELSSIIKCVENVVNRVEAKNTIQKRELLLDFIDSISINDCAIYTKEERGVAVDKYLKCEL